MTAIANYETANQSFPAGRLGCDAYSTTAPCLSLSGSQRSGTSGFVAILPNLDSTPLFNSLTQTNNSSILYPAAIDGTTSNWSTVASITGTPIATGLAVTRPAIFACPSDHAQAANPILSPPTTTSSYAMVMGTSTTGTIMPGSPPVTTAMSEVNYKYYNNGAFIYLTPRRASDVRDGLSNTYFLGETIAGDTPDSLNAWPLGVAYLCSLRTTTNPLNTQPALGTLVTIANNGPITASGQSLPTAGANGAFASQHPLGANFAYGGGNVKFTSATIDFATYEALSTIAGSEPLPADDSH